MMDLSRLPRVKRRIAMTIRRTWYGIGVHELHRIVYEGRRTPTIKAIKSHVWQLREVYGLPIHSQPGGHNDGIYVWRFPNKREPRAGTTAPGG
jgi:hypothetical protein